MPEKLPQTEENLPEKGKEKLEVTPLEDSPPVEEKDFNVAWNELMEDYDLLSEFGYNPVAASEVKREVNGEEITMIEIPKDGSSPAYVKKENIQEWVHHLKDEKELTATKEKLNDAYEGKTEAPVASENQEIEYEEKDKLTPEELETVRGDFQDLSDSVRGLYDELNQRDQENFSPLVFREHLNDVFTSAANLQSAIESKNLDVDELNTAITLTMAAINEIGNVGVRGEDGLKEDSQSLEVVSRNLRGVFDATENAVAKMKNIEKGEADYLSNSLKRLSFSTEEKYNWVERKRLALDSY